MAVANIHKPQQSWLALAVACSLLAAQAQESSPQQPQSQGLNFSSDKASKNTIPLTSEERNRSSLREEASLFNRSLSSPSSPASAGTWSAPRASSTDGTNQKANELNWLQPETENGRPSAAAFNRAAGVRDDYNPEGAASQSGSTAESSSPASLNNPPENTFSLSGNSGLQFSSSLQPISSSRGSFDPLFQNTGLFQSSSPNTSGSSGLNSPATTQNSYQTPYRAMAGQSDSLSPLSTGSRTTRSIRDLISTPSTSTPRTSPRSDSALLLDADSTREELNPYLPGRRQDYQAAATANWGDSRLGIESRSPSENNLQGPSPLRSLAAPNSGRDASSLAPAMALPFNNSPTVNRGFGRPSIQSQFPTRQF